MKFKKPSARVDTPLNDKDPLRVAFLGGPKCGKTALISKLTLGTFRDTYYPLRLTQPILFSYTPSLETLRVFLDESHPSKTLEIASQIDKVVLSPVIYHSLVKNSTKRATVPVAESETVAVHASNGIYASYSRKDSSQSQKDSSHSQKDSNEITPILMELIDTPAFNPTQIVPFLEASLYVKLDRDVLHNLADEPRRPVSTNPLLVASGVSEMNGLVDGYFFLYSAIPSYDPPAYEELDLELVEISPTSSEESYNSDGTLKSVTLNAGNTTFGLLPVMKSALEEAWKEYHTYKTKWDQGKERDVFSFKSALRGIVSDKEVQNRSISVKLMDTSLDPSDPSCSPPIWIVCTNVDLPLASPKLIDDGKRMSKLWKCGYVGLDMNSNVDESLALMVREVVERRALQKGRGRRL